MVLSFLQTKLQQNKKRGTGGGSKLFFLVVPLCLILVIITLQFIKFDSQKFFTAITTTTTQKNDVSLLTSTSTSKVRQQPFFIQWFRNVLGQQTIHQSNNINDDDYNHYLQSMDRMHYIDFMELFYSTVNNNNPPPPPPSNNEKDHVDTTTTTITTTHDPLKYHTYERTITSKIWPAARWEEHYSSIVPRPISGNPIDRNELQTLIRTEYEQIPQWYYEESIFQSNFHYYIQRKWNVQQPTNTNQNQQKQKQKQQQQQPKYNYETLSDGITKQLLQNSTKRFTNGLLIRPNYVTNDKYSTIYFPPNKNKNKTKYQNLVPIRHITIIITSTDIQTATTLQPNVDESYELYIPEPPTTKSSSSSFNNKQQNQNEQQQPDQDHHHIQIIAPTVYGIFHGLQTLQQLLQFRWMNQDRTTRNRSIFRRRKKVIEEEAEDNDDNLYAVYLLLDTPIYIRDAPTYPYRGFMIDTSRHYLPLSILYRTIDTMVMNKLNVFHWHITDRNSWPYVSTKYPELSTTGSYCLHCIYTKQDIQQFIQYSGQRGIRVIMEMDLPGHSEVIRESHPEFMSECDGGIHEPLDVTKEETYQFVYNLYDELASLQRDTTQISHPISNHWIHIGGDEVQTTCWADSISIREWMETNKYDIKNEIQLLNYFQTKLLNYTVDTLQLRSIVWQDLLESNVQLPLSTIIDIWKIWDYHAVLQKAIKEGYTIIYSACWYLDYIHVKWDEFYACDPRETMNGIIEGGVGDEHSYQLMIGGHAAMWSEEVDETNFEARVWPRTSAMAEKLWTGHGHSIAYSTHKNRMNQFRCLMMQQVQVAVSPLEPGIC